MFLNDVRYINKIPDEVLKEIFSYFNMISLVRISQVNKHWYQLLKNPVVSNVKRELNKLKQSKIDINFKNKMITLGEEIIFLSLFGMPDSKKEFENILSEILSLKSINKKAIAHQMTFNEFIQSQMLLATYIDDEKRTFENALSSYSTHKKLVLTTLHSLIELVLLNKDTSELVSDLQEIYSESKSSYSETISHIESHLRLANLQMFFNFLETIQPRTNLISPSETSEALFRFTEQANKKITGKKWCVNRNLDSDRRFGGPLILILGILAAVFDLSLWMRWIDIPDNYTLKIIFSVLALFLLVWGSSMTLLDNKKSYTTKQLLTKAPKQLFFKPQEEPVDATELNDEVTLKQEKTYYGIV